MKKFELFQSKYTILLASLLSLLLITPFLSEFPLVTWLLTFVTLIIFITAIIAIKARTGVLIFLLFNTVLSMFFNFLHDITHAIYFKFFSELFFVIFCILVIIIFSHEILSSKKVTRDTILGAICIYLLIGTMFALIYQMLEVVFPGSFVNTSPGASTKLSDADFYYFSFITLTTVGYGDIAVLQPQGKSFVVLESITGIFYLATLVAHLISRKQNL